MSEARNKLRRSRDNRILAGVCGGLGEFFWDSTILVPVGVFYRFYSRGSSWACSLYHFLDYHAKSVK